MGTETVMVTEEQSPKQQSPKRNKDSSGWLGRDQKGEMENPSPEVAKVAASAKRSDVKKFASTKHDKLPEKKKMEEETKYDRYDKEKTRFAKADKKMKFGKFYDKAKEAQTRLRKGEVKKWDPEKKRYVSNRD